MEGWLWLETNRVAWPATALRRAADCARLLKLLDAGAVAGRRPFHQGDLVG